MAVNPPIWCARCRTAHQDGCPQAKAARAARRRRYDAQRGTAKQRGYGAAHRKWRELILRRDPFCMDCLEREILTPSTDAHHIVKFTQGGDKYAMDNGMGLCAACHTRRTARGE